MVTKGPQGESTKLL